MVWLSQVEGVVLVRLMIWRSAVLGGSLSLSATEWFSRANVCERRFRHSGRLFGMRLFGMGVGCEVGSMHERFNSQSFHRIRVASCIEFKLDNLFGSKGRFRGRLVETTKLFAVEIGHVFGEFVAVRGSGYFFFKSSVFGVNSFGGFSSQVGMFF